MMAYGADLGFETWLETMGYELPAGVPDTAILRARGSAYLDGAYEALWTGNRTDGVSQADAWPRTGAKLNCVTAIADNIIPTAIVNAAYRAAWLEASTPGVLSASFSAGQRVKRQRVEGAVEREFFDDGGATIGSGSGAFIDSEIDGTMRQFICARTSGFIFQSVGC